MQNKNNSRWKREDRPNNDRWKEDRPNNIGGREKTVQIMIDGREKNRPNNDRWRNNFKKNNNYKNVTEERNHKLKNSTDFDLVKNQKIRRKIRKIKSRRKKIVEKQINDDKEYTMNDDDIALTLAMAEQYQYYTESEEEDEEYEHDPLLPDTDLV